MWCSDKQAWIFTLHSVFVQEQNFLFTGFHTASYCILYYIQVVCLQVELYALGTLLTSHPFSRVNLKIWSVTHMETGNIAGIWVFTTTRYKTYTWCFSFKADMFCPKVNINVICTYISVPGVGHKKIGRWTREVLLTSVTIFELISS